MSAGGEGALQQWLAFGAMVVIVGAMVTRGALEEREGESVVYRSIKICFWWLLGVTIGVYFQARLNLK